MDSSSSVDNVTKYVIYGSSDGTVKDMKIAEVEVGTHSYAITDVVNIGYLLVIAAMRNVSLLFMLP